MPTWKTHGYEVPLVSDLIFESSSESRAWVFKSPWYSAGSTRFPSAADAFPKAFTPNTGPTLPHLCLQAWRTPVPAKSGGPLQKDRWQRLWWQKDFSIRSTPRAVARWSLSSCICEISSWGHACTAWCIHRVTFRGWSLSNFQSFRFNYNSTSHPSMLSLSGIKWRWEVISAFHYKSFLCAHLDGSSITVKVKKQLQFDCLRKYF